MSTSKKDQKYAQEIDLVVNEKNGRGAIYIGNIEAARNLSTLQKLNIKAVISVAKGGFLNHSQDQLPNYMYLPALDNKNFDLSIHFQKTFDFIDRNRRKSNVLVHCIAGISRSATLVIAYLMRKNNMTLVEAYTAIKRQRPIVMEFVMKVQPNEGFINQLNRFQDNLKNGGQIAKENRSSHIRNKSCDIISNYSQPKKAKPLARANQSQDKIKPINLQQKINALRQKFAHHTRRLSCADGCGPYHMLTARESIMLDPSASLAPPPVPLLRRPPSNKFQNY